MTAKQKCTQLAAASGVTLTAGGEPFEIVAEAPPGKTFACEPGLTALVCSSWDGEPARNLWADMHERLSHGLEVEVE